MMNSLRKIAPIFGVIIFALACGLAVQAQTTGVVRGTVTDPNGAVVSGATVTLTKKSTNVPTTTTSGSSGQFEFQNVLPGNDYELKVEARQSANLPHQDPARQ